MRLLLRLEPNLRAGRRIDVGKRVDYMKTNERSYLFPLFALVLIGGCAVGPHYKRPAVDTPDSHRFGTGENTNSFGDLALWEVFKDPAAAKTHCLTHRW